MVAAGRAARDLQIDDAVADAVPAENGGLSGEIGEFSAGDTLALESDEATGTPLLDCVMRKGKRTSASPTLAQTREYARAQRARIAPPWRGLDTAEPYPVEISTTLRELARQVDQKST